MNTSMNTASMVPFAFGDNMVRLVRDDAGDPWFLAKDVCRVLELGNVSKALRGLDEDEKADISISDVSSNGVRQARSMLIITESGLYALVFRSRKQEAKAFSKWVRSEVLPTLRRTGRYAMPGMDSAGPEVLHHVKPAVRERLLSTAQRVINMNGGGTLEEVEALFLRYCQLISHGTAVPGAGEAHIDAAIEKEILRFAEECCQPDGNNRIQATRLYTAFARWWQKKHREPAPSMHLFGRVLPQLYRKTKCGGHTWYLNIRLAA